MSENISYLKKKDFNEFGIVLFLSKCYSRIRDEFEYSATIKIFGGKQIFISTD